MTTSTADGKDLVNLLLFGLFRLSALAPVGLFALVGLIGLLGLLNIREEIAGEMHHFVHQLVLDIYALRPAQQYGHHLAASFHQPLLLKDLPEIRSMFWFGNDPKLLSSFQVVANVVEAKIETFLFGISSVGTMRLGWTDLQIKPHILYRYRLAILHLPRLPLQENCFSNVFLFAFDFGFGREAYGAACTAKVTL